MDPDVNNNKNPFRRVMIPGYSFTGDLRPAIRGHLGTGNVVWIKGHGVLTGRINPHSYLSWLEGV